ncbi:MAG: hypothetical protein RSB45_03140 [Bacilli bacterium]
MIDHLVVLKNDKINHKYKLYHKQLVKTLPVAVILSLTVLLSGCGSMSRARKSIEEIRNNRTSSISTTSTSASSNSSEVAVDNSTEILIKENNATLKTTDNFNHLELTCSDEALAAFTNYLESNESKVNYTYENLYNIEESMESYKIAREKDLQMKHTKSLKGLTASDLYDSVKANNAEYFAIPKHKRITFYKELADEQIKDICEIVMEVINQYKDYPNVDIDRVKCVLSDLKMVEGTSFAMAEVDKNRFFTIMPKMIKIKNMMDNADNSYKKVIMHESVHLLQTYCIDEDKKDHNIGTFYDFEELPANALYMRWFVEGSTDRCVMNLTKEEVLTYVSQVGYIDNMKLATILNPKNSIDKVETLCFSGDLEELFNTFSCQTEEEKAEIIKMMYSISITQDGNEDAIQEGFYNKYTGDKEEKGIAILQRDLRSSVFLTLSKEFYSNLAISIKDNQVSLQDVFFLITVYENNVNLKVKYNKAETYPNYKEFMNHYVEMQDEFFTYLTSGSNLTLADITEEFNQYALNTTNVSGQKYQDKQGEKIYNCELKWLDDQRKDFIFEKQQDNQDVSSASIRFIDELYAETMEKAK